MKHLASVLAAACLAAPSAAFACSPAAGYRVPTNLELAQQANLILIGRIAGDAPTPPLTEGEPLGGGVIVEPVAAIKGLMPADSIVLRGMAVADGAGRSDPAEFAEAHPDSYGGACIRRQFPRGATVLFFLQRADGEWTPAGGPFSRWAEDVSGPEAPWSQLAVLYAHASQLSPEERSALFADQIEALQARQDDELALRMAGDIERQLAGPNDPLVPPLPEPSIDQAEDQPLAVVQRGIDALRGRDDGEEAAPPPR